MLNTIVSGHAHKELHVLQRDSASLKASRLKRRTPYTISWTTVIRMTSDPTGDAALMRSRLQFRRSERMGCTSPLPFRDRGTGPTATRGVGTVTSTSDDTLLPSNGRPERRCGWGACGCVLVGYSAYPTCRISSTDDEAECDGEWEPEWAGPLCP